jgi:hypothetical protein
LRLAGTIQGTARAFGVLGLLAGLTLAFGATSATAKVAYVFSTTFAGSGTTALSAPTGIAVDNSAGASNGDVYVTDTANHRVEKFDSAGNFLLMFGKGVNSGSGNPDVCTNAGAPTDICQAGSAGTAAGQFTTPSFVAVDSSSGPSSGDVYVGDTGSNLVQKFDPSGDLLVGWGGTPAGGQLNSFGGELGGIAVDSGGSLYAYNTSAQMSRFNEDGSAGGSFQVGFAVTPTGIAVDTAGNLYIVRGFPAVERLTATGGDLGQVSDGSGIGATGLVSGGSDVFVDSAGESIVRYSTTCDTSSGLGCTPIETFGSENLNGAKGVAVNTTTNTVYVANTGDTTVAVFKSVPVPDVATQPATDVLRTTATLNAHIDPAGGGDITACHFDYGTDTGYNFGSVPCSPAAPYSDQADVTADVSNLSLHTVYHFRAVASNGGGTINGPDLTFKTAPEVIDTMTQPPTNVENSSATFNGSYTGDGIDTQYYFDYGTNTDYGQTTAAPPGVSNGSGSGPQSLSTNVTGLVANTVYHYRLVAHNDTYGTTVGLDQTFLTAPPALPVVDGTSSSGVSQSGATLSADIRAGFGPTIYRFEYGPNSAYGGRTFPGGPTEADNDDHTVTATVNGLAPGITYHFRVIVTNFAGTTVGPDQTFTTPSVPLIGLTASSAVGQSSAAFEAFVNPSLSSTTYHFEYGTTVAYGSNTPESASIGSDNAPRRVVATVTGLAPGTTYHFRVVARNGIGIAEGGDETVTTAAVALGNPTAKTCRAGYVLRGSRCTRKHKRRKHHHNKRSRGHG